MFDYYEPVPTIECLWCDAPMRVWQGNDGSNALFVWRQGEAHPVDQPVVEESRIDASRWVEFRLPQTFSLTGWCVNDHTTNAIGRCVDGVWTKTYFDADDLRRAGEQRERDRVQRVRDSWGRT